jgi:hypothetical protein
MWAECYYADASGSQRNLQVGRTAGPNSPHPFADVHGTPVPAAETQVLAMKNRE